MAYFATYNVMVNVPPSKAFDYIADISRHGEWGSADDRMKVAAEKAGPPAVGARYNAEGVLNGKVNPSVVTVTTYDPPKRLAFDAQDSNSVFHHEFVFTPEAGGTRVERQVTMTKGPWFFPIVLTIFKGTVVKNYNGAMSNVKAKLESTP
jgi:uncharacterized protein YndB with AHSA1/START domain